jgi:hypothetical protein
MYFGHAKRPLKFPDLNEKVEMAQQFFVKFSDTKFHENSRCSSLFLLRVQTDGH